MADPRTARGAVAGCSSNEGGSTDVRSLVSTAAARRAAALVLLLAASGRAVASERPLLHPLFGDGAVLQRELKPGSK